MDKTIYYSERYNRFSNISISEKILNSCFLAIIGLGYLMALANLYLTHQSHDGRAGLSVEDIKINYYGSPEQTRLGAAINGIMAANLKYTSDKDVILKWIKGGAQEPEYNDHIAPILNRDCIGCHTPEVNPSLPNLTSYSNVLQVARASGGATMPYLVRVSHIHLFGIAFILFFIGKIFLLCELNVVVKRVAVAIPFLTLLLDVASWYVTKFVPAFAYVVIASGALMGCSIGLQIVISIYQMWFQPSSVKLASRPTPLQKRSLPKLDQAANEARLTEVALPVTERSEWLDPDQSAAFEAR